MFCERPEHIFHLSMFVLAVHHRWLNKGRLNTKTQAFVLLAIIVVLSSLVQY